MNVSQLPAAARAASTATHHSAEEIYEDAAAAAGLSDMTMMNENYIMNNCGIDLGKVRSYVFALPNEATKVDPTVIIFEAADADTAAGISAQLESIRSMTEQTMNSYAPDQGAIAAAGQVRTAGALVFKAGVYYHTGLENNGYYATCEKTFRLQGEQAISGFVTGGITPNATDAANASITGGCSLTSLFSKSGADALTAGFASAHIDGHKWETAIELNYRYQIGDHFYVSPDMQWILNPMGDPDAKNALVGTLRLGFEL